MTLNAQLSTTELGCTVMNKIDPRELLYIALLCIGFLKLTPPLKGFWVELSLYCGDCQSGIIFVFTIKRSARSLIIHTLIAIITHINLISTEERMGAVGPGALVAAEAATASPLA